MPSAPAHDPQPPIGLAEHFFLAERGLLIKNPHCTYWRKTRLPDWHMGREERRGAKAKHLLAVLRHAALASDGFSPRERRLTDSPGSEMREICRIVLKRQSWYLPGPPRAPSAGEREAKLLLHPIFHTRKMRHKSPVAKCTEAHFPGRKKEEQRKLQPCAYSSFPLAKHCRHQRKPS